MISLIGNEYNKEITQCCLDELYKINEILRTSPNEQYAAIVEAIRTSIDDLTVVLREETGGKIYKKRLQALSDELDT
jgi:rRNA-processing protein FCF1